MRIEKLIRKPLTCISNLNGSGSEIVHVHWVFKGEAHLKDSWDLVEWLECLTANANIATVYTDKKKIYWCTHEENLYSHNSQHFNICRLMFYFIPLFQSWARLYVIRPTAAKGQQWVSHLHSVQKGIKFMSSVNIFCKKQEDFKGGVKMKKQLTLIRMTKDEKGLAFFKGLLL